MEEFSEGRAWSGVAVTSLFLLVAFLLVYPFANSGAVGGGSDNDDALNITGRAFMEGRYPYYAEVHPGRTTDKLPGMILTALPFVLLGNSAYQNLFWFAAFFLVTKWYLGSVQSALFLFWTILLFSPVVLQQFVTGTTGITNSFYILVFIFLVTRWVPGPVSQAKKVLAAVLLGIGLSSRANYLLLLPLVFSFLVQNAGWKSALIYTLITCLAFGWVTAPFYLYDPKGFAPLYRQFSRVSQFKTILPFSGIVIPFLGFLVAILISPAPAGRQPSSPIQKLRLGSGFSYFNRHSPFQRLKCEIKF